MTDAAGEWTGSVGWDTIEYDEVRMMCSVLSYRNGTASLHITGDDVFSSLI